MSSQKPMPNPIQQPPQLSVIDAFNIIANVIQDAPIAFKDYEITRLSLQVVAQFIQDNLNKQIPSEDKNDD